ncbi:hypothetical protein L915_17332 [Phytophthora nicotianae]|uniref:Uncharacterized protein n=4 Tax=Phytophthora nicotianae TaxID=4792 RepID=W2R097_PHYN3|nr:hypothetical protein PPTG_04200 [Phytophthora nicotianae INRA-310]ETI35973.1 hypothetical protein F443_17803 [Phytophthora nicotianae P1569]ETK76208.1 hypothetical protein L915_17332 [Phytophthora nicotianae]ETO64692.1 hypothetical protein F444_17840 [Phytophthora nicotianae P1976]KUF76125.1 hypothetical protein AM587_10014979 [Phytophthora nicotianae]ETM36101.1 hypothetical protein L914_17128 [Phytophthora nicotianae]
MSNWGLRLNPFSKSYSQLEMDQMRFVHQAYCEAMEVSEEDLPTALRMDDNFYPLHNPTISDFDENSYLRKMQDVVGLLRNPAEAIISSICAYQRERYDRTFTFSGYLNDPRTLLLEEFKDWAMRTLAPATCTTESILIEVRRRHSYVLRLQHGQQGLFHSGTGERSLLGTLKDVRNVIETRVLPTIETERAHSSAREQLHTLEARGTDGLMHGVQFLFYVLRNTPNTPADCTISNLQSQQHAGMKDAMGSKSGQMLEVLLTTPSFKELFPQNQAAISPQDSLPSLLLTNEEEEEMTKTAVFCDTDAKPQVPTVLTRQLRRNSNPNEVAITPSDFLQQSNSGVVTLRKEVREETFDAFTKLHGLLKLLADLLVSCRKARQLAGPGGDLLVYGPGGEEVRRLMQSLEAVQTEISKEVSQLTRIGVRELDRLKPNQEKAWRWSFSKVLPLEGYLARDFGACVEPIQRMYASADPLHVQKMYKQFKQATGLWVEENNSICRYVTAALGGGFIEDGAHKYKQLENGEEEPEGHAKIELLEDETPSDMSNALVVAGSGQNSKSQKVSSSQQEGRIMLLEDEGSENDPNAENQLVVANRAVVQAPKKQSSTDSGSFFSSLVSWGVGAKSRSTINEDGSSPVNSETDEDDEVEKGPSSSTSSKEAADIAAAQGGVLDTLLLVRQSIQRIGQLSWGVRTSFHTSSIDEGDFDAFIVLCSIYETCGVPCSSDLLLRVRLHRTRLSQLLKKHIQSILNCVVVLQRRIVDEEKSIPGMTLVYRRLRANLSDFESEMDDLLIKFKQVMVECSKMKAGILAMPLSQQRESNDVIGMGAYAYNSINALASSFGPASVPSEAILSHGEYMTQLRSQLDLHWNSISHLFQSLQGTVEAVTTVDDRLRGYAKFPDITVPPQQLDYIFEFNYDGFFRQTTKDLEVLLTSFDTPK